MEKIMLIDGLGDYSATQTYYKRRKLDYFIIYLLRTLNNYYDVQYFDLRDKKSSKNDIFERIDTFKPDYILIKGTPDNIYNISNLGITCNEGVKCHIFSFDNDYNILELNIESIILNAEKDFHTNIKKIQDALNYKTSISNKSLENSKNTKINVIDDYSLILHAGFGCQRKCSFCHISDTNCTYVPIESLISEIKELFSEGLNRFYIKSHNLSFNIPYLELLCESLFENFGDIDYVWSCSLIPEELSKCKKNIFRKLKQSKCEIVELNVYSVNESILLNLNIQQRREDIIKAVEKLYNEGISSIVINYLIGFSLETDETLNELLLFSEKLIDIAPGVVEFNLSYIWDSYNQLDDLIKNTVYSNTASLPNEYLYAFKSNFYTKIYNSMGNSISKTHLKNRIAHCKLSNKRILTQYFIYFISKSSTFNLFSMMKSNPALKFSWEIKDDLLEYCPVCGSLPLHNNALTSLAVDSLLLEESNINKIILSKDEEKLYKFSREYIKLKDIIEYTKQEMKIDYETAYHYVFDFYKKLEMFDLIYYTRIL